MDSHFHFPLCRTGVLFTVYASLVVVICHADIPAIPHASAEGYTIQWAAVSWQGSVKLPAKQSESQVTVSGVLTSDQTQQAAGYVVDVVEATDATGRSLMPTDYERRWSSNPQLLRNLQVQRIMGRHIQEGQLGGISIALGGGAKPVVGPVQLRGSVYVMEVVKVATIDLPLTGDLTEWKQALPDAKFRIEKVDFKGNQMTVQISHTMDNEELRGHDLSQPPYLFEVVSLNDKGDEIKSQIINFGPQGEGRLHINGFSPNGETIKPASIRLRFATEVTEKKIPFQITNLDMGLGADQLKAEPDAGQVDEE